MQRSKRLFTETLEVGSVNWALQLHVNELVAHYVMVEYVYNVGVVKRAQEVSNFHCSASLFLVESRDVNACD